jgi:hypothetical protein
VGKDMGRKTKAAKSVVKSTASGGDARMSLRKISAELAARGYLTASGKPYVATAVQSMVGSPFAQGALAA